MYVASLAAWDHHLMGFNGITFRASSTVTNPSLTHWLKRERLISHSYEKTCQVELRFPLPELERVRLH